MPNVAGQKFPYTAKGMKDAKAAKKRMGMMGGGSARKKMAYGGSARKKMAGGGKVVKGPCS